MSETALADTFYGLLFLFVLGAPLASLITCIVCRRHRVLFGLAATYLVLAVLFLAWIAADAQKHGTGEGIGYGLMLLGVFLLWAASFTLLIGGLLRRKQARDVMNAPPQTTEQPPAPPAVTEPEDGECP